MTTARAKSGAAGDSQTNLGLWVSGYLGIIIIFIFIANMKGMYKDGDYSWIGYGDIPQRHKRANTM